MNQFVFWVRTLVALFVTALAFSAALITQSHAADLVGATAGELGVSPSGSASYSIPIAVPVGTTGLQPKITLQYDSLAGNGVAGMGWTVGGLAFIGRCPTSYNMDGTVAGSPGLDPVDYDANDKFCLNGQRLVPVSGTYGAPNTEYRTTQEEFSKVVSYGTAGSGPQYFKVWRKSGEVIEFGNTADSRIEALGRADVWIWALNRLSDTVGNYETFTIPRTQRMADSASAALTTREMPLRGCHLSIISISSMRRGRMSLAPTRRDRRLPRTSA